MQKNLFFSMSLIEVAILSGCSSVPTQNSALADAHNLYSSAQANPQVTSQAALELKEAGDSLNKADEALSKGQDTATINHLAYVANQKVRIAKETATRKTSELAVANADTQRDKVRLEARTAEADAAKQQLAIAKETSNQQAADLTERTAEADEAEQQVASVQKTSDLQAAALAAAGANAERDKALIAQQQMQLSELNAKKTERGFMITLGDVLFSTNKVDLKSGGTHNVQKLADFLKQYPQQKVLVEGYTDSTGGDSLNQELSDQRANAVRTALLDMGINSDRISTRGYGKAFPVAGNDTASNRQLNRRVEIILSGENGNIIPR